MKISIFSLLIFTAGLGVATDISGSWKAQITRFSQVQYARVTLRIDGTKLAGTWNEWRLEGEVTGDHMSFSLHRSDGRESGTFTGEIKSNELSGEGKIDERGVIQPVVWKMTRLLSPPAGGPKTWDFEPREFQVTYSASIAPRSTFSRATPFACGC